MAIDPSTLLPGTLADANEVQLKFDELFTNITDINIAANAEIQVSKLEDMVTGQVIVGTASTRPAVVTMSGDATINDAGVVTVSVPIFVSGALRVWDTALDHFWAFTAGGDLSANRNVTLPVLAGDDVFVFEGHTQTISNKTNLAANGSAANPSHSFASNTNLGMYRSSANIMGFAASGIGRFFVGAAELASTLPLNMNNSKITQLATPTVGTDAVNKDYVDAADAVLQGQIDDIDSLIENDGWDPVTGITRNRFIIDSGTLSSPSDPTTLATLAMGSNQHWMIEIDYMGTRRPAGTIQGTQGKTTFFFNRKDGAAAAQNVCYIAGYPPSLGGGTNTSGIDSSGGPITNTTVVHSAFAATWGIAGQESANRPTIIECVPSGNNVVFRGRYDSAASTNVRWVGFVTITIYEADSVPAP